MSVLEPPPPANLFQVTLASNDLYGYLKRLAAELSNQSAICAKVSEEVTSLKAEFSLLSKSTVRMNEEHAAKVMSLSNSLNVTVNQAQMRAGNTHLQKQIDTIARLLEVNLNDEGTMPSPTTLPLQPISKTVTQPEIPAKAQSDSPSSVKAHPIVVIEESPDPLPQAQPQQPPAVNKALSVSNQNSPSTKPQTQYQNPTPLPPTAAVVPSSHNAGSGTGIRNIIDKCLQEWYKTRGLVDAKIRHEITTNAYKSAVAELEERLREHIRLTAAELVSIPFFHESQESLKSELIRHIGAVSNEVEKQRTNQTQFEAQMRVVMIKNVRKVTRSTRRSNKRISRFYEMMALPEPVDEDADASLDDDEDDDDYDKGTLALAEGRVVSGGHGDLASNTFTDASNGIPPPPPVDDNDPTAKILGVPIAVPRKAKVAGSVSSHRPAAHTTSSSANKHKDGTAAANDDGVDARTHTVIQSPVFVAFRQHVLNDISERIAAARSTQSSDIDIELLAMRNDIRQRVTSTRVVELIKQYTDTDTPARVAALARQISELSDTKVSVPDLNDGLRSKADVHILDTKANVEYVDKALKALLDKQSVLQSDLALLIADRREYRDVVQQLLIQQQRLQATMGAGPQQAPTLGQGNARSSNTLPPIGVDGKRHTVALQSLAEGSQMVGSPIDGIGVADGDVSLGVTGTPQSKPTNRTAADSSAYAPRPITELISPRMAGGTMPGTVIHSPSPPLPMLHKPAPPAAGNVVPITSNQEAYAKLIASPTNPEAEHFESSPHSPRGGGGASLAAARADVEQKSPLQYQRREKNVTMRK